MLEIANLEVVYHSAVLALRGVSLSIPEGKIVAILGPNGAGKTTLLRAITNMLAIHEGEVTKGHIRLAGRSVLSMRPAQIVARGVAQVMEGRRIFADLSVEDNLLAGAYNRPRREIKSALHDLYGRFPILRERRKQLGGFLSGGEQQMLAIGRGLMSLPKLLMFDEPSLGLAPMLVKEIFNIAKDINAQGTTVLMVEQNVYHSLNMSNRAYVLENGRFVLEGKGKDLLEDENVKKAYMGI